ncbi:MAG: formimidoylglutamate deiminase [Microbacterium sp.]
MKGTGGAAVFACAQLVTGRKVLRDVVVEVSGGVLTRIGTDPAPGAAVRLGTVVPGIRNAHSHAFHRLLRGRTHVGGGDFWRWREAMYAAAAELTPDRYERLATEVYREMRDAGYTSVSEFHYVHHRQGGTPYADHDMERALAAAARVAGIRLVLLDACYLSGGIGEPLRGVQQRFGDGTARAWLDRWHRLREALAPDADRPGEPGVVVGAAVHSVRAVARDALAEIAAGLPGETPLHVHVSEQPAENEACLRAYGLTPTGLLAESGLLAERTSLVHATHLTEADIALIADAAATVVMCPTTEADLGDGIGPAPELAAAGVPLRIGSDQHAVIDPWEELARLESDQRLRLGRRGVFTPAQLWAAGGGALEIGQPFDAVELDTETSRTRGADAWQLPLVARSGDVRATIVGGIVHRADAGSLAAEVHA